MMDESSRRGNGGGSACGRHPVLRRRVGLAVLGAAIAGWAEPAWASMSGYAAIGQILLFLLIAGGVVLVLGATSAFWSNRPFFWVSLVLTLPVLGFAIYVAASWGGFSFFFLPVAGSAVGLIGLVVHVVRFRRRAAVPPGDRARGPGGAGGGTGPTG